MATFDKIDRISVIFPEHDVKNVNLNGGTYSASMSINTMSGQEVELRFENTADLKKFVELVMTAATKMPWTETYPSSYQTASQGRWSVEDVLEWKRVHDETLSNAQPGDVQVDV